ncbi:hypothetical protein [Streptomyces sp. NPDC006446]|uniref:hypothetical protein n=1 Tax=Streptomyces sp. NPDC006446 TaxID=3154301 RepID=UPI0033A21D81
MSQPTPPPGNPFAGKSDDQPPVPQGAPQPGFPVAPVAPAAPARDNLVLGLAAALGAGLVSAVLYGLIIGLTKHEIGYAAVGVGFLVGIAAGRAGGRNQILPIAAVIFSVASVYLGQMVGEAMIIAKQFGVGFSEVFFDHIDVVQEAWKSEADPLTFVFFAVAAYVAFQGTRKAGL